MFEVGWTEMLVIAIVMIVVVGPKDLPKMLRTFGRTTSKLRSMAGDFQRQFNEALKEAELDDVKKSVDSLRSLNPMNEVRKQLNPFEKAAADVRAGLESLKPAPKPVVPSGDEAVAAEPLKNGATEMPPISGGPDKMPDAVQVPAAPAVAAPAVPAAAAPAVAAAPVAAAVATPVSPTPATVAQPVSGPVALAEPAASPANGAAGPARKPAARSKAVKPADAPVRPAAPAAAKVAKPKAPAKAKTTGSVS